MCVLTIPQLRHQERVLHPSLLQLSPDFGSVKTSVATLEVRFSGLMRRCWVYDLRWFMYMFTSTWSFLGLIRTHIVYVAPSGTLWQLEYVLPRTWEKGRVPRLSCVELCSIGRVGLKKETSTDVYYVVFQLFNC